MASGKKGLVRKNNGITHQCLRVISAMPLVVVQLLFLLFWTLLFVLARRLLKQKKRGLLVTLFACVFVFGVFLIYRQIRAMRLSAIVIEPKVILYAGPSTTYQQVGVLSEGYEVRVDRQRQDFCKIKTKNQFGWVARSALGFI